MFNPKFSKLAPWISSPIKLSLLKSKLVVPFSNSRLYWDKSVISTGLSSLEPFSLLDPSSLFKSSGCP